ncbi:glycine betaine ABC transporter substrate-binding protein [Pelagicoccus sp. SDUM812003]|uniref:glycine betaine ABC transporter substrate-binding protein n=1 Tax=Pelagicoccus sp. SDUM812003 TaxID=3041267 RepID=UPI00280FECA6|nr:glycine betaine ABC transporter substrate-binding protein [Pelagicoccus sp. SDUM812003]MDQ8204162.1 glycine betaine ABC transporter substrate-binding protein [Pelagicoccus sp. SDUM812003]
MKTDEYRRLHQKDRSLRSWANRFGPALLIGLYEILLVLFLLVELDVLAVGNLRATNQALMLVALFFLPFVVLALSSTLKSLRLNLQGHEMEMEFNELKKRVDGEFRQMGNEVADRLGDSQEILFTILGGSLGEASRRAKQGPLLIGSKQFRSSRLLAHLLQQKLIRDGVDIPARVVFPNGSTLNNFAGIAYGHIDAYVEYTATAAPFLKVDPRNKDVDTVVEELNERCFDRGIRWLKPFNARDNYFIIIRRDVAESRGIRTVSQLATHSPDLTFAALNEFFGRADGYEGLRHHYGFNFKNVENRIASGYKLLDEGEADATIGWESHIERDRKDKYAFLIDDRNYFPNYMALPVVRAEILEIHPEILQVWSSFDKRIDTDALRTNCELALNRGDREDDYRTVAADLLDPTQAPSSPEAAPAG